MADEAKVLCLYAGGTIGMVRQDANSGFAPYPSFLTETLRSQSRFHDPSADSIFSWSDSVDRYKAWSEAYTRPASGTATPNKRKAPPVTGDTLEQAARAIGQQVNKRPRDQADGTLSPATQTHLEHLAADSSALPVVPGGPGSAAAAAAASDTGHAGAPPFGPPVWVRSSAPKGTSTHHAVSSRLSEDGSCLELQIPTLITPRGANGKRVRYAVLEYDPLLDSSEMDIPDWIRLATDISLNYKSFDSFIVLHGTDTMAYTSSALSMLLENLGKSVIVTGAQVPLSELRNDAIENVLGALMLAGSYIIPEVGLYFASTLYRGNRTSKVSNNALAAFDSPNMAPLARVGINIEVSWNLVERSRVLEPFRAHNRMSPNVALLRLFPGLPTSTVRTFLSPPLQGVVLESYGAGNAPSRPDLLEVFREASARGVVIVNITQCMQGEVSAIYAVGKKLEAVGVVAGSDMTPECALAKLSYLLGKPELEPNQVRELMGRPLRGELTPSRQPASSAAPTSVKGPEPSPGVTKTDMKTLLAHILQNPFKAQNTALSGQGGSVARAEAAAAWDRSDQEVSEAASSVLPYLIYEAAASNDLSLLQWHLFALSQLESTIPPLSMDEPTLHLDTSSATTTTHHHSTSTVPLERLRPLHIASSKGHLGAVQMLLEAGCSVHARDDVSGHSPLFLAAKNGHLAVVQLLKNAGAHLKQDEVELARFWKRQSQLAVDAVVVAESWKVAGLEE
ncbi:uncharacterized protein PFL1_01100 [Pseudozyma flocculosa PF-1]|uniref:asparaginase n=1 Tax=Pseudozyma flocculosa TaxID=84751 RepID=A0A5C3FBS5_9BASI|nr:uncharacterized protein PFL1_01100 [Pseudozyma flocculosa PF-1]EPQ31768.1 hypothetical protein PFL1_01100 [Pseudozyma flocculosa PF-1]SPO41842.1 related to l-asparaginase [Pseudozyma flocculosa]